MLSSYLRLGKAALFGLLLGIPAAGPARCDDYWLTSSGVNGASVRSDASTLTCSHDQCSIWELTSYEAPLADGASSLKDFVHYDCAGQRTRTEIEIRYGASGEVLGTVKTREQLWQAVQPGTVGADTLAFACKFPTRPYADLNAGAVTTMDRTYSHLAPAAAAAPDAPFHPVGLAGGARVAVQFAASPSRDKALRAIAELRRRDGPQLVGRTVHLAPATVAGARLYRAIVLGFSSVEAARSFCAHLKALGTDCFVRRIPSPPPRAGSISH